MRLLKRSIFIIALFAVLSMSTVSMAQSRTNRIDYCNGKATVIVQYAGSYATHTARLIDCDIYASDINCRFGTTNIGCYHKHYPGYISEDYSHGYNKNVGSNAGTAYSQLYKGSSMFMGVNATRN